jgi:hypothetical protein
VTVQRVTDSEEVGGWGFSYEGERVMLHRLPRGAVVLSVFGKCVKHIDPPN